MKAVCTIALHFFSVHTVAVSSLSLVIVAVHTLLLKACAPCRVQHLILIKRHVARGEAPVAGLVPPIHELAYHCRQSTSS